MGSGVHRGEERGRQRGEGGEGGLYRAVLVKRANLVKAERVEGGAVRLIVTKPDDATWGAIQRGKGGGRGGGEGSMRTRVISLGWLNLGRGA